MDISTPSEQILNNISDFDSNKRLDFFYDKETTSKFPNQIKSFTLNGVSIRNKDLKKLTSSDKKKDKNNKSRSNSKEKIERSRSASKDHMNVKIKENRAKTPKVPKKRKKEKDSSCYNLTTLDNLSQRLNHENILYQVNPFYDLDDDEKLKRDGSNDLLQDILSNQQNTENENEQEFQSDQNEPMNQAFSNMGNKTLAFTIKFKQ